MLKPHIIAQFLSQLAMWRVMSGRRVDSLFFLNYSQLTTYIANNGKSCAITYDLSIFKLKYVNRCAKSIC